MFSHYYLSSRNEWKLDPRRTIRRDDYDDLASNPMFVLQVAPFVCISVSGESGTPMRCAQVTQVVVSCTFQWLLDKKGHQICSHYKEIRSALDLEEMLDVGTLTTILHQALQSESDYPTCPNPL